MTQTQTDVLNPWLAPLTAGKSLRKQGIHSFFWLVSSQGGKLFMMLVSTMVLVRLLQPADFGLLAMAATVTSFFMLFKDAGLTTAVVQQTTLTQGQVSTLFWLNLMFAGILSTVTLVSSPFLAKFYNEPQLAYILIIMATGFLFSGAGVQHEALMRRALKFKQLAVLDIASTGIAVTVSICMAFYGCGWWSLVVQQLLQLVAYSMGCWIMCNWRPSFVWAWGDSKSQFHFGAQVSGFNFVNYFSRNADNILIGRYWGAADLGIYAKSYSTLLAPLRQIAGPMGNTLQPLLGRLRDEPERYRKAYLAAYTPAILIMLPIGLLMFMLPEAMVQVIFGNGWDKAIPVLQWMGVAVATQLAGSSTGTLLLSQKRGKDYMATGAGCAVLSIMSFAAGLPFGIGGVAAAYVAGYLLFQQPYMFWVVGRKGPVTTANIYSLLHLPLWCAAWAMPALLVLRLALPGIHPVAQLIAGVVVTGIAMLAALAAVKDGRKLFKEALEMVKSVKKGKK